MPGAWIAGRRLAPGTIAVAAAESEYLRPERADLYIWANTAACAVHPRRKQHDRCPSSGASSRDAKCDVRGDVRGLHGGRRVDATTG